MLEAERVELTEQMSEILSSAVTSYQDKTGDKNAYYLRLPKTNEGEFGSRCHPGLKSHENAANCIVDFLLLTPANF